MIKEVESVVMNKTVSECRTSNCAFKSEESDAIWFTSEVLASENQESGLRCDVEIFTRTDFSESDHTVISHFEGKKTPICFNCCTIFQALIHGLDFLKLLGLHPKKNYLLI